MKNMVKNQPFLFWSIVFGLLGVAGFSIVAAAFGFSRLGLFPITMFVVLFATVLVAYQSVVGIVKNSLELAEDNFNNTFPVKFDNAYELYDDLLLTRENLLSMLKSQEQNPNITTYKQIKKLLENYNKLLLSVNNLSLKDRKAFEHYCLSHQNFDKMTYEDQQMEDQLKAAAAKTQHSKQMKNMLTEMKKENKTKQQQNQVLQNTATQVTLQPAKLEVEKEL